MRLVGAAFAAVALLASAHRAAAPVRYVAYLPAGYATSGLRYPVVYFLHGLPATGTSYRSIGWLEHALDAAGKPAILVAPQGATEQDADPEYLGRWETAIATELPRLVDARYRTIASRSGRALVGVSAGGYGAMHIAFDHLGEYSAVESWSGYFHPTDPTGEMPLDLGSASRNAAANVHRQLATLEGRLDRDPLYIAFYIGKDDTYTQFVAENETFNQELSAAGIAHVFRLYPGGHSQSLWAAEAPAWLRLALNHLSAAR
ncbi:MAG: alpha/beta hydrolase-fold protein [Actinomycetota bacterium]